MKKIVSKILGVFLTASLLGSSIMTTSAYNPPSDINYRFDPYLLLSKSDIDAQPLHHMEGNVSVYVSSTFCNIGVTSQRQNNTSNPLYMADFVRAECQKFPNGAYWDYLRVPGISNQFNSNSYTRVPCKTDGYSCGYYKSDYVAYEKDFRNTHCNGSYAFDNYFSKEIGKSYYECNGFARKLLADYFGTDSFIDVDITTNPQTGKVVYEQTNELYQPRIGDHIRFKDGAAGHSIWVYAVDQVDENGGMKITYADCNSDGNCQIQWNKTAYINKEGVTFTSGGHVTLDYVERPMAVGDINGDTFVNWDDINTLLNIILSSNTPYLCSDSLQRDYLFAACDITQNGIIDMCDLSTLNMIISGTAARSYGFLVQN